MLIRRGSRGHPPKHRQCTPTATYTVGTQCARPDTRSLALKGVSSLRIALDNVHKQWNMFLTEIHMHSLARIYCLAHPQNFGPRLVQCGVHVEPTTPPGHPGMETVLIHILLINLECRNLRVIPVSRVGDETLHGWRVQVHFHSMELPCV